MIEESIKNIEDKLNNTGNIAPEKKKEIISLLSSLKEEIESLPPAQQEQTESILGFAQVSTHEATRPSKNEKLLGISLDGLNASVKDFERSHPELVENINAICNALSNLGI